MTLKIKLPDDRARPIYLAIAQQIAEQIRAEAVDVGQRLPDHRALAQTLNVSVGTVSKAYKELQAEGLLDSGPGRGTFVATRAANKSVRQANYIDLRNHAAPTLAFARELSSCLLSIASSSELPSAYWESQGPEFHRIAGAKWLRATSGVSVSHDHIVITNGVQHALACCLIHLTSRGDTILAEEFTYPGLKMAAEMLGLNVLGVPMDNDGMRPDLLDRMIRDHSPKAIVVIPNIQNPTTVSMGIDRKKEIIRVIEKYDTQVIEDDVYGCLMASKPPSLFELAEDRIILVSGLSKGIAPSLRVGYVAWKSNKIEAIARCVRSSAWMASPLSVEVATKMINEGVTSRLLTINAEELQRRNSSVKTILGSELVSANVRSPHCWVQLPQYWRIEDFLMATHRSGIRIQPASEFSLDRERSTHRFRVSVSAARDTRELEQALAIIDDLIKTGPRTDETFS